MSGIDGKVHVEGRETFRPLGVADCQQFVMGRVYSMSTMDTAETEYVSSGCDSQLSSDAEELTWHGTDEKAADEGAGVPEDWDCPLPIAQRKSTRYSVIGEKVLSQASSEQLLPKACRNSCRHSMVREELIELASSRALLNTGSGHEAGEESDKDSQEASLVKLPRVSRGSRRHKLLDKEIIRRASSEAVAAAGSEGKGAADLAYDSHEDLDEELPGVPTSVGRHVLAGKGSMKQASSQILAVAAVHTELDEQDEPQKEACGGHACPRRAYWL